MRNAAHVPQLHEEQSALPAHCVGCLARRRLLMAVDDARGDVALPARPGLGRFGNDQAGAGALAVILGRNARRQIAGFDQNNRAFWTRLR